MQSPWHLVLNVYMEHFMVKILQCRTKHVHKGLYCAVVSIQDDFSRIGSC